MYRLSLIAAIAAGCSLGATLGTPCPIGGPVLIGGQQNLSLNCGGTTIGGFGPVYYHLVSDIAKGFNLFQKAEIDNSLMTLESITVFDGPNGPFMRLIFQSQGLGQEASRGFNFYVRGWSGGQISLEGSGASNSQVTFCNTTSATPPTSWIACATAGYLAFAQQCFGYDPAQHTGFDPNNPPPSCPVESPEAAGVLDAGAIDVGAKVITLDLDVAAAATHTSIIAVRLWSLPGTVQLDIPIRTATPEPASFVLVLTAGALIAWRHRR